MSALQAECSDQHSCRQGARVSQAQASMNPQRILGVRHRKVASPFSFSKIWLRQGPPLILNVQRRKLDIVDKESRSLTDFCYTKPIMEQEKMDSFSSISMATGKHRSFWWPVVILLIVIVIAAGFFWFLGRGGAVGGPLNLTGKDIYQAVFLDNNQVYFGKLSGANQTYAALTDIFYLQIGQPLQPSDPAANINLIKLGGELHGPIDEMKINREHILFIENLRDDSQVVQAIKRYKEQQAGQNK